MKRPTMTTVKSFIKKNHGNLFINVRSAFDGQIDGCSYDQASTFKAVNHEDWHSENTLGIKGAWFVRNGNDYVTVYQDGEYEGFEIYNCCGKFFLTIKAA